MGSSDPFRSLHREADGGAQLHEEELPADLYLTSLKMHFDLFLLYLKNQTCLFSGFIKSVDHMDHPICAGVKSVSLSFILSLPAVRNKTQQQRALRLSVYI